MSSLRVYTYKGCSTCKNAIKWLKAHSIPHEELPIRETPPSPTELKAMLKAKGSLRPIFNTSSADYRDAGIKDKLDYMSTDEAFSLMQKTGNLVKRPFLIDTQRGIFLTGFKEDEWSAALK
jgi:arsenate reductase (glutaredoxin)